MIIQKITDHIRCIYCGTEFRRGEPHPPGVHFINGYPFPCRYNGKNPEVFEVDRLPWVMAICQEMHI